MKRLLLKIHVILSKLISSLFELYENTFKDYKGCYVLCFHDITNIKSDNIFSSSIDYFESIFYRIKKNVISINDLLAGKFNKKAINFVLSFDDGFKSFYTVVTPLLQKHNVPAVVYISTDFINRENYLSSNDICSISQISNITIGSHMQSHSKTRYLSKEEIQREWKNSKDILESISSLNIEHGALPYGSVESCSKVSRKIGLECGYKTIATTLPRKTKGRRQVFGRYVFQRNKSIIDKLVERL